MSEPFTEQDAADYTRRRQLEAEGRYIADTLANYVNRTSTGKI